MQGPLAQMVALTCHGNAAIRGIKVAEFFTTNSTCKFCSSVRFVELKRNWIGKTSEVLVAKTPDEWLDSVLHDARHVILRRSGANNREISDRMSAGFVGGGGTWTMEVLQSDDSRATWASRWEVGDRNAPNQEIWNVTYGLVSGGRTGGVPLRPLAEIKRDFEQAIADIHEFSKRMNCGGFTKMFADAFEALRNPDANVAYQKDLFVPGTLPVEAECMLRAAACAWVFGGMGSWNDMGFEGADGAEYDRVSERLFTILNEAIAAAASSWGR